MKNHDRFYEVGQSATNGIGDGAPGEEALFDGRGMLSFHHQHFHDSTVKSQDLSLQ